MKRISHTIYKNISRARISVPIFKNIYKSSGSLIKNKDFQTHITNILDDVFACKNHQKRLISILKNNLNTKMANDLSIETYIYGYKSHLKTMLR